NTDQAILFVAGSTFSGNQALGGSHNTSTGGSGAAVGAGHSAGLANFGVATIAYSTFEDNEARGGSGNSGDGTSVQGVGNAFGGAIFTGAANSSGSPASLILDHVTLRGNRAVGGDGNTAGTSLGTARGGGLETNGAGLGVTPSGGSTTTVRNSTIADNQAI